MSEKKPGIFKDVEPGLQAAEEPPCRVIIHNDDFTPVDFVVYVLREIFLLAGIRAVQVMYTAHYHGEAYVQTLPKSEAQRRVHRATYAARLQGFPLEFSIVRQKDAHS